MAMGALNASRRNPACSRITLLAAALGSLPVAAGPASASGESLTTAEIRVTFSDVIDHAVVLDRPGTTAINRWYADGRFQSRWQRGDASGELQGYWTAVDGVRCVRIDDGQRLQAPRCGAIRREGEHYLSLNPDGSPHGRHRLAPLRGGSPER